MPPKTTKKKRGSSFLETVSAAFNPKNKEDLKAQAAAPNRAEIDRNSQLMQASTNTPTTQAPRRPNFTEPEIIRNADTGEPTFVKMPDGRVVPVAGENSQQVQDLVNSGNRDIATPEGAVEATDAQAQRDQAADQQEAILQLQSGELGQGIRPSVDLSEVPAAASAALNIPAIGAGAASGAALGAGVGSVVPGVGTVIGGVVGGVVGGISAFLGKLSLDKRQTTKEANKVFTVASGERMTQIMNLANSGIIPPADVVFAYEQNLANIRASRAALREQTKSLVGRQLSGAMDELIVVESYLQNEPFYRAQLMAALAAPNPGKMYEAKPFDIQDE